MVTGTKQSSKIKRPCLIAGLILVGIGILSLMEITNITDLFHKEAVPVASGASYSTKGDGKSTSKQSGGQSSDQSTNSDKSSASSSVLLTPSGSFVSNHRPNLSGSPAPNTIASVCNTTPGATCIIRFTQNDTTKSLPSKTSDENGSAYWNWKLQDVGVDLGIWKIEAKASLNGQTKTASDAMDLVVTQ